MRNTTKLKHLLMKYSVCLDMDEDGMFALSLVDKIHPDKMVSIEGKSYSIVLSKAYSYFLKEVKDSLNQSRFNK